MSGNKITKLLALIRSQDIADQLSGLMALDPERHIRLETADATSAPSLGLTGIDAVLLEIDPEDEAAVSAIRQALNDNWRHVPVVAIAAQPSVQQIRRLMHLGVVDVMPCPLQAEDLETALGYAAEEKEKVAAAQLAQSTGSGQAGVPQGGIVVSALKAGGGVGATSILVQAAVIAAQQKRRPRVAVLDLDVQFGSAALYLDLAPRAAGFADLMEAPERLDAELLAGAMSHHASGVDVLPAPSDMLPLDAVTPEFVQALIATTRASYDLILIDLPADWTAWSYSVLSESDKVLLVTQYTVSNIRRAARQRDTLLRHEIGDQRVWLVMNRFETGLFQGRRLRDVEKAVGHRVDICVPNDFKAAVETLNEGVALVERSRRHPIVKVLRRMVTDLEPKREPTVRVA